jgi:hypothetical protein
VSIADNDVPPPPPVLVTVAATDANAAETATGVTPNPGQFTLTRTGSTNAALTVNVAFSGTATHGVDYTSIPSTVTFAAGSATALVNLNVTDDSLLENVETATLTLNPGSGYTLGSSTSAAVSIADNDVNAANFNIYMIGNSLTDQVRYTGFESLVETRGTNLDWGRHMIPGAPLEWIYNNPTSGFQQAPYGYYPNALANYTWDAITLQPFDRLMPSDLDTIDKYLSLLDPQSNPDIYIYAQWPRIGGTEDWETQWNKTYTGNWDATNRTKDYYEDLVVALRQAQPEFAIYIIPVGHVMEELDNRMEAGLVPGYDDITDIYVDDIHLSNDIGSYIVATTFYATVFKQSPIGLPVPTEYQPLSNQLAAIVQDTVWDIVPNIPLSGF